MLNNLCDLKVVYDLNNTAFYHDTEIRFFAKTSALMEQQLSPSVTVKKTCSVPAQIIGILKNTLWGTPGKTMYQHLQTDTKIFHIRSPYFFMLERLGTLLFTVCLAWRNIPLAGSSVNSFYIRYFVASPSISGDGKRNQNARKREPSGILKQFMENIFGSGSRIIDDGNTDPKAIFYAYVESENEQSMQFCNYYKFRTVRKMATVPFSRFNPKISNSVRKAKPEEHGEILTYLKNQYEQYNFLNLEHLFYQENYFVAEHDGNIVAGVQANPVRWAIKNLPGISGKLLIKVLPYIPYLKRLINPKQFDYSALEGLFVKDGFEWMLDSFLESVIAQQEHHAALIWFDTRCPVLELLRRNCNLGLMDAINSNGEADIIVRGEGLSDLEWTHLENQPAYISCFDLT